MEPRIPLPPQSLDTDRANIAQSGIIQSGIIQSDIVRSIETLLSCDKSFALFRLPGKEPVLLLQKDRKESLFSSFGDVEGTGFVLCPFDGGEAHPVVLIRNDETYAGWDDIAKGLEAVIRRDGLEDIPRTETVSCSFEELKDRLYKSHADASYAKALSAFLDDLAKGTFQKLVLSRSQDIAGHFSAGTIFLNACASYPGAMVSLVHGICGTWIGASPEILMRGSKTDGWQTMALAGTRKAGTVAPWDDKNSHEQAIVADYIRSALAPYAADLAESDVRTFQAGGVEHLRTDFSFSIKENVRIQDVVACLHPTPAVCGLPKAAARRRILTAEAQDRRYYSGFLGFWDKGEACSLYVNLRCLKLSSQGVRLYAGGGILPQSDPDSEWLETCGKMCTMLALLGKKTGEQNHVLR